MKFPLYRKADVGIDTFQRQYNFCTKSHRSILYSCCGEVSFYSFGSDLASLLGEIVGYLAAKCSTMFTKK